MKRKEVFSSTLRMSQLNNLYSFISTTENLEESWKLVKKNKGAPGIDGEQIQKVERKWDKELEKIKKELEEHSYHPRPARRVYIPKSNGKKRALGIPTVRDRIVQQATRRIIEPFLDPTFENFSYGFRPGKSAKQALRYVDEILEQGQRWAIRIDLEKFFDTIPHEKIINALRKHIKDEEVIQLVREFLGSGVMEEGKVRHSTTGTPQGGVISPLLANLVLDAVDKYVTSHGPEGMARYADDFIILCKTGRRAAHVYKEVVKVLNELGLTVNEEKSRICHSSERFTFLGYEFGGGGYYKGDDGTIRSETWKRPSRKAIEAFKDRIRYLTRRQQPKNIQMLVKQNNAMVRGWGNYFKEGRNKKRFAGLDEWYRMRLRSFIHKKKSYQDNSKYPISFFREKGYVFLSDVLVPGLPKQLALRV